MLPTRPVDGAVHEVETLGAKFSQTVMAAEFVYGNLEPLLGTHLVVVEALSQSALALLGQIAVPILRRILPLGAKLRIHTKTYRDRPACVARRLLQWPCHVAP